MNSVMIFTVEDSCTPPHFSRIGVEPDVVIFAQRSGGNVRHAVIVMEVESRGKNNVERRQVVNNRTKLYLRCIRPLSMEPTLVGVTVMLNGSCELFVMSCEAQQFEGDGTFHLTHIVAAVGQVLRSAATTL